MVPNKNRRTVLKSMGGLAVGSALAGCTQGDGGDGDGGGDGGDGGSTPTATPTREPPQFDATMGIVATELNQIPSITALAEMLPDVSDGRLTGSVRTFRNSSLPMQALVSGAIDYYALSPGVVFQAVLAGNDLRILSTKNKGTDYLFIVNTDQADVGSIQELLEGGYSVGVAGLGGLSHMQVAAVMVREGYDPEQADIQSVGGSGTRTSAVAAGNIDATIIHIDQFQRIKSEGAPVRNIGGLADYFPNFVAQTITVRAEDLEKYDIGAHIHDYIHELVKAHKMATEDFDWIFEKTQKFSAAPISREDARESWEFNANVLETWPFTEDGYQYSDYQDSIDILKAGGVLTEADAEKLEIEEIVNRDLFLDAISDL